MALRFATGINFTPHRVSARRGGVGSSRGASVVVRAGTEWEAKYKRLVGSSVRSLTPDEAENLVKSGDFIFVDVRPEADYETARIPGAKSCPLFIKITKDNLEGKDILRALALAVNGVTPMKTNPNFNDQVVKAAEGKGVVLYCEAGGTLQPSTNFPYGKSSRSLSGCFQLLNSGAVPDGKIMHLNGGIYAWDSEGKDVDGEYDGANAGRTPAAAAPAQFPAQQK